MMCVGVLCWAAYYCCVCCLSRFCGTYWLAGWLAGSADRIWIYLHTASIYLCTYMHVLLLYIWMGPLPISIGRDVGWSTSTHMYPPAQTHIQILTQYTKIVNDECWGRGAGGGGSGKWGREREWKMNEHKNLLVCMMTDYECSILSSSSTPQFERFFPNVLLPSADSVGIVILEGSDQNRRTHCHIVVFCTLRTLGLPNAGLWKSTTHYYISGDNTTRRALLTYPTDLKSFGK